LGARGARNLVVDGFVGLRCRLAIVAALGVVLLVRQFVGDRDRGLAFGGVAFFLARLRRADNARFRIEQVGGVGDLGIVEGGVDLGAGAAGADDTFDNALDLILQPLLESGLALKRAGRKSVLAHRGTVGEQASGLIDDRDRLRVE